MIRDDAGTEAARFRAAVSGFAVLYDGDGRLRFAGGLIVLGAGPRGRQLRADAASLAVLARARRRIADDAPVFGCCLVGVDAHLTPHPAKEGFLDERSFGDPRSRRSCSARSRALRSRAAPTLLVDHRPPFRPR